MEQKIDELQHKVEELSELVTENQRMIKSLYRRAQVASYFVFIKWGVIVALTIGSLYYIQPYLETMLKFYSTFGGEAASPAKDLEGVNTSQLLNLLKNF
ncbi:MAG: hypothetical protein FGM57_00310 [Candidatus Taylorbacteria bacterium]|nr:hypothetical protein [Candidatus Taylorbacteria bacterium]